MSCKKYRDILTAYLDDDLALRDREAVKAHLGACPDCRALSRRMDRSAKVFKAAADAEPAVELPAYFAERVSALAVEERHSSRPWAMKLGLAFGSLALLIGLLAGFALRPYFIQPDSDKPLMTSISFQSEGIGVEIDQDSFIIHSRDKRGETGIDLKF